MKFWLLRPVDKEDYFLWTFDCAFGFVVGAIDEEAARKLAASDCGDEGPETWLDPALTTCIELLPTEGILMRDFNNG